MTSNTTSAFGTVAFCEPSEVAADLVVALGSLWGSHTLGPQGPSVRNRLLGLTSCYACIFLWGRSSFSSRFLHFFVTQTSALSALPTLSSVSLQMSTQASFFLSQSKKSPRITRLRTKLCLSQILSEAKKSILELGQLLAPVFQKQFSDRFLSHQIARY